MNRLIIILYTLDNFVLALLTLGGCKIGETISSVAWELELDGKWLGNILRPCIDFLLYPIERNHCFVSWLTYQRITKANHG